MRLYEGKTSFLLVLALMERMWGDLRIKLFSISYSVLSATRIVFVANWSVGRVSYEKKREENFLGCKTF